MGSLVRICAFTSMMTIGGLGEVDSSCAWAGTMNPAVGSMRVGPEIVEPYALAIDAGYLESSACGVNTEPETLPDARAPSIRQTSFACEFPFGLMLIVILLILRLTVSVLSLRIAANGVRLVPSMAIVPYITALYDPNGAGPADESIDPEIVNVVMRLSIRSKELNEDLKYQGY